MSNSKLYYFFLADGYKITINVLIFFELLFFIIIIWKTVSKKKSSFNLLFLLMINSIISGILSAIGYLLNWKVKVDDSDDKVLLFGDGFLCQTQSFMIAYFQSTRETFCSLITIIVFMSYKIKNFDIQNMRPLYKFYILLIGNGIPLIANITYSIVGMFGESHLFCFTKKDVNKTVSICGTIHFTYIVILILLSFFFILHIIIKDCKNRKNVWTNLDETNKKKCFSDPQLKKIIFYPFAQILSNSFIFYHRFKDFLFEDENAHNNNMRSGPAAVVNTVSSLLYIIIFILSNDIFCSDEENENKLDEKNNDISLINLD